MTIVRYNKYPGAFHYYFSDSPPTESPVERKRGAWFILMGFAGYNSRANNLNGYATEAKAVAAILRYQAKV